MFENFVISEKVKRLAYDNFYGRIHFWRNTQQAEIDFLEVIENEISIYEIKYSPKKQVRFTKSFTEKYHPVREIVINKDNFWEYL